MEKNAYQIAEEINNTLQKIEERKSVASKKAAEAESGLIDCFNTNAIQFAAASEQNEVGLEVERVRLTVELIKNLQITTLTSIYLLTGTLIGPRRLIEEAVEDVSVKAGHTLGYWKQNFELAMKALSDVELSPKNQDLVYFAEKRGENLPNSALLTALFTYIDGTIKIVQNKIQERDIEVGGKGDTKELKEKLDALDNWKKWAQAKWPTTISANSDKDGSA